MLDRLQGRIVLFLISLILAACAMTLVVGFGGVGLFFLYSEYVSQTAAAFLTAGSALLFALFVLLIPRLASRARARRSPLGDNPSMALGALLGGEFLKLARKDTRPMVLFSLMAGFAVGLSPSLRKFLLDLVKL